MCRYAGDPLGQFGHGTKDRITGMISIYAEENASRGKCRSSSPPAERSGIRRVQPMRRSLPWTPCRNRPAERAREPRGRTTRHDDRSRPLGSLGFETAFRLSRFFRYPERTSAGIRGSRIRAKPFIRISSVRTIRVPPSWLSKV
jgi:hypothetical protein